LDPHPFHADPDPDPGFEKFADADPDPDPGCGKFLLKMCAYLRQLSKKRTLSPDQNADPDLEPGTPEMRILCGSGSETLFACVVSMSKITEEQTNDHFLVNPNLFTLFL